LRLPRFEAETFGRWAESFARFMGTAKFLVYMTVFILLWIGWNTLAPRQWRFDPYTFTFLTLMLSLQASYAAPLILLAQNRQADRDRLALEEDRRRATLQKADVEYLSREIAALRIGLGEVATRDFLRAEFNRLGEDLAASVPVAAGEPQGPAQRPHRPKRDRKKTPRNARGAGPQGRNRRPPEPGDDEADGDRRR
jgi:uncharacterized membrane protein